MTIPALSPPAPVPPFAPGALPAINPSPAPATIPISFINDPTVQRSQIVNMGGVLTGIPFNEGVSGSAIKLPLPPLPTPLGAVVSVAAGAYPLDYQTAGSNLLEANQANSPYNLAAATYNIAVATLQASGAYATYGAALVSFDAAQGTFQTATDAFQSAVGTYINALLAWANAYATWLLAGSPVSGPAYDAYSAAGVVAFDATTTWETTVQSTYVAALDTFDPYVETSGDPSPEVVFNAAVVAFINAAGIYTSIYGSNYLNYYAPWVGAGSPGSGALYDAWQTGQAAVAAAGDVWDAAINANAAAIAAAVPAGTAAYEASTDYLAYVAAWGVVAAAWSAYVTTYNGAQSALNWWTTYAQAVTFQNSNKFSANPYSSTNPV